MGTRQEARWQLVREIGLEYAAPAASGNSIALQSPAAAERLPGGGYLVVDDVADDSLERRSPLVPPRRQWRTLVLSAGGQVLFDTDAQGIEDGFGCSIGGDRVAILRCAQSDLVVLAPSGEIVRRIDLSGISAYPPRFLSRTHRETFLVAFLRGVLRFDIVEIDGDGGVLRRSTGPHFAVGVPASMQLLRNGSILIADEFQHVVHELHWDGSSAVRWGRWHQPAAADGQLSGPRWAQQLDDGTLLIADTLNHRILAIDSGGRAAELAAGDGALVAPSAVTRLPNGNFLVCDAGNGCVVELDRAGKCASRAGTPEIQRRLLSFPRSVQYLDDGRYLIADTAHNRVVQANGDSLTEVALNGGEALFWPRAARGGRGGATLIADGRHARVLELSAQGQVLRQLNEVRYQGRGIALRDPHDVRLLANGNLLITDAAGNLVVETDWDGQAARIAGLDGDLGMKDPHSAQALPDGRWLITDTGNHRILYVDANANACESVTELQAGARVFRLNYPKYAELGADGTLMVVDSENHRVLLWNAGRDRVRELSQIPGSPIPSLRFPRWAQMVGRDEIVVSDHSHHRILHLRLAAD